ncbi:DUF481 domain-containing protein [Aestuariibacter halophilus]|uniref:DUF481 domain-containing protein n=1 Tax=Fluctibacter halophilus TaxID=226011 RepID=A0ABS8G7A8_9ALTE|nr:DUF481 domain-containing protein [Aestuariibacter halophilus]MCC2616484.1 DUF481 domain-containing protein [Aestuariibacter halophilus]
MKKTLLILCCAFASNTYAQLDAIDDLFLSDTPIYGEQVKTFTMTGELGILEATGNTQGTTLTGKVNAKHNLLDWHHQYTVNFLYKRNDRDLEDGSSESFTSAQRVFLSTQSEYKLEDPNHRLFIYGEYEDDRFNGYDYQAAMAVGWSTQVWDTKDSELRYSVGPGYAVSRVDDGSDGDDQMGLIVRAALEYEKKLTETSTFRQFFSTETDTDFSRSVSETSLAARINGALAMKLSLNMIHNTRPQHVGSSLDTETAVTLVYNFF